MLVYFDIEIVVSRDRNVDLFSHFGEFCNFATIYSGFHDFYAIFFWPDAIFLGIIFCVEILL